MVLKYFRPLSKAPVLPVISCLLRIFFAQDEVIAVSKKIVVRVEDLVKWTCQEPPQWKHSSPDIPGSDGSQDASSPQEGKTEGDGE